MWFDPRGAYAILALLILGIIGATMAPGGLRDRPRRTTRIIAGAVLFGVALSLLWPEIVKRPALEADPVVPEAAQLAGLWLDGADTLQLKNDGAYACHGARCTGFGANGRWTREADGSLNAHWSDGHTVPWRVALYHGRYRLSLMPAPGAGATWEGRLLFEKVGP